MEKEKYNFWKEWKEQAKEVPEFAIGFPIMAVILIAAMLFAGFSQC
jgi:hypothetical protein